MTPDNKDEKLQNAQSQTANSANSDKDEKLQNAQSQAANSTNSAKDEKLQKSQSEAANSANSDKRKGNDFKLSEERFTEFQRKYAEADNETKTEVVNALLIDIATELEDYIHYSPDKRGYMTTGSIFGRLSEKIIRYFTAGAGDSQRFNDENHLKSFFKLTIKNIIVDKIREVEREQRNTISLQQDEENPIDAVDRNDFIQDVLNAETIAILTKILVDAQNNRSEFGITKQDAELIELRFYGDPKVPLLERKPMTFVDIAKRYKTYPNVIRRRYVQILDKLRNALDSLDQV